AINNTYFNNSNNASGQVSAIRSSNSTVYIVGNLIYNNDDFGIFTTGGGNHYLVNNTIFGNSQGIRVENDANTFIHNSIIQNNTLNFATSSVGEATIEMQHSLTNDATFPTNVTNVSNNLLNSDALFTNVATNDFSLQSDSPAINAGNPNSAGLNIPPTDILGNERIDDIIIDLGAIEFQNPLVSIIDIEDFSKLSVYPNPTNSLINVVYEEDLLINIYTIDGKFLGNYTSKEIDLTDLTSGVYLLKIENLQGNVTTKRIIKK
ncbi:MAG: T9SS type A sorting domain-containing protein, partial [Psychroflexus maritimus]